MNELQLFNYEGRQVRTIIKDGETWFVAKDVCEVLGLANMATSIQRIPKVAKDIHTVDTLGGCQNVSIINESGLYKLAFTSRKEEAEKFTDWVATDVLPSIRKTGSYSIQPQSPTEILARAVLVANEELSKLSLQIQEIKPKAEIYDRCMESGDALDMGVLAKMLGIGRNNLFAELRYCGVLMDNNVPYGQYAHHFKVIEKPWTDRSGQVHMAITTKVRQTGIRFISKKVKRSIKEVA